MLRYFNAVNANIVMHSFISEIVNLFYVQFNIMIR